VSSRKATQERLHGRDVRDLDIRGGPIHKGEARTIGADLLEATDVRGGKGRRDSIGAALAQGYSPSTRAESRIGQLSAQGGSKGAVAAELA
jgi:hypothetical protein